MLSQVNKIISKNKANADSEVCAKVVRETIKQVNAEFNALSPAKKRVAIAKDVIANINANLIDARRGVTCETYDVSDSGESLDNVNNLVCGLITDNVSCECCAVGSMLASTAINNKKISKEVLHSNNDMSTAVEALKVYWPRWNLMAIEIAFERGSGAFQPPYEVEAWSRQDLYGEHCDLINVHFNKSKNKWIGYECGDEHDVKLIKGDNTYTLNQKIKIFQKAVNFRTRTPKRKAQNDSEILIAIMENVIKNDGIFLP